MSRGHKEKAFRTSLGSKANVGHEVSEAAEGFARANDILRRLGSELLRPVESEAMQYRGSCAIHIYQSEKLGELLFVAQVDPMQDVPEVLASAAFEQLKGSLMEKFGRKRRVLRSGF
jgi:hypothetical protein